MKLGAGMVRPPINQSKGSMNMIKFVTVPVLDSLHASNLSVKDEKFFHVNVQRIVVVCVGHQMVDGESTTVSMFLVDDGIDSRWYVSRWRVEFLLNEIQLVQER
jgi:hypothetical protein